MSAMRHNVGEFMRRNVFTVHGAMTVGEVARALVERKITGAPVVDDLGHPVGVISFVDLTVRGVFRQPGDSLASLPVEQVMTRQVIQISPDLSVRAAVGLFRTHRVHRLIVTRDGKVVGTLSPSDLLDLALVQDQATVPFDNR